MKKAILSIALTLMCTLNVLADDITIAANNGQEVDFDDFKLNIDVKKV